MNKLIYTVVAALVILGSMQIFAFPQSALAADTSAPSVPTSLSATVMSASRIDLNWTASNDNVGVTGYNVYRGSSLIAVVSGTSYSDVGLAASTTYGYSVAAFDAAGNLSAQTPVLSIMTLSSSSDMTAPSMPTDLNASVVSDARIDLSWTASTDNVGIMGYKVYRDGVIVGTASGTTFSDTGLLPSTVYNYTVAAFDAAGNLSAQISPVAITTLASSTDVTPPSMPSDLHTTFVSNSRVDLYWTASSDNVGVAGYNVYRDSVLIGTASATTFSDTGVSAATTYHYTVAAFDAAGNVSVMSNQLSVNTSIPHVDQDDKHESETGDMHENEGGHEIGDMHRKNGEGNNEKGILGNFSFNFPAFNFHSFASHSSENMSRMISSMSRIMRNHD